MSSRSSILIGGRQTLLAAGKQPARGGPKEQVQALLAEKLAKHLSNVSRLMRRHRFTKAVMELSKAIFLCPKGLLCAFFFRLLHNEYCRTHS